ncbi:phage head protein [Paraburkholderia hospita]|nr:phage head protein [Paraburkholderia hospita]
MAAPTNTLQTYQAVGNREDLTDIIYRISPTETPFMSGIGRGKAKNTLHEWQTQDLAAPANNAQVEGDDATADAATPTARLNNRTQISRKVVIVSGTQTDGMDPAGRKNELAYQISLKGLELKRDMETGLCQNTTLVAGSATVARQSRGLEGWVATNCDMGAGGAAPNYNTNTAPTDGTQRAFTEAQLKNVAQLVWQQGGNPGVLMLGGTQKQTFSTFTGASTRFDKGEDKQVTAAVDIYITDFGRLRAVPNRFQRARTAFVLEMGRWKVAYLRAMRTVPLAKTGDAEKRMLICEYSLEAGQEKSGGAIRDLL